MKNDYDACLLWILGDKCNLRCAYCFSEHGESGDATRPVDGKRISEVLDSSGMTFLVELGGGGEPLLVEGIVDAISEITKNHYVSIVTNLTCDSVVADIVDRIDPSRVSKVTSSLHIEELEKAGMVGSYIRNLKKLRDNGFNVEATTVAYPPVIGKIEGYKKKLSKEGVELHVTPFMGNHNGLKYPRAYRDDEAKMITDEDYQHVCSQKGNLCTAGFNTGFVDGKGDVFVCHLMRRRLGNIYEGFGFRNRPAKCPFEECGCPPKIWHPALMDAASRALSGSIAKNTLANAEFLRIRSACFIGSSLRRVLG
jgi:MoaA/NifB/PqqE/SkfB family radical SAM enzyme